MPYLFSDEAIYHLKDEKAEKEFNFDLAESLKRAQESSTKLFNGYTFYITENVKPGLAEMKQILQAAGAKAFKFELPKTKKKEVKLPPGSIIVTTEGEVKSFDRKIYTTLYSAEFVMSSILRQEIKWDAGNL